MHLIKLCIFILLACPFGCRAACDFSYDKEAFFKLKSYEFDQNPNKGWRLLAKQDGCKKEAADLISAYLLRRPDNKNARTLRWHEGQMRALVGDYSRAIQLFSTSYNEPPQPFGWNFYVAASIAFLEGDRETFLAERDALAKLPKPDAPLWPIKDAQGNAMEMPWPMNMHIVDNLLKCFGRPYSEAYGGVCVQ